MSVVRVKGLKRYRDRHGKWRTYHRKTGLPITAEFGSAEFFAEMARLDALAAATAQAPKPGTLGMLILAYCQSPAFSEDHLAPRTRRDYRQIFNFLKPLDAMPLTAIDRPFVAKLRDRAGEKLGWRRGNYVKGVLSVVCAWGAEHGFIPDNPARGVKGLKRPKGRPEANRPWSDEERFAVLDAAPWHLKVPIAIGMFTGLREADVLALTKTQYDGRAIERRTNKTNQLVWWPIPTALKRILDEAPKHEAVTLAVNSYGHPWTADGFSASFRKFVAGLRDRGQVGAGLTFHGLRHTVGAILAEEGFADRDIADALGHASEGMARRYSRRANLTRKMSGIVVAMDASENRRRTKDV